jgi:hypothetical protein
MLRATIWRDLRWRLLAALMLGALLSALVTWSYVMNVREGTAVVRGYPGFLAYLDDAWFRLPGPSSAFLLLAVIVTAWSGPLRPRDDLAYLLSLPISRRRLLLTHVATSLASLSALVLVVDVTFVVGAWSAGTPLALGGLIGRSLLVMVAGAAWVGVTVGAVMLLRYPLLAMIAVLGAVIVLPGNRFRLEIPARPSPEMLAAWDPWALADPRAWQGAVPIASLLTAAALGAGGTILALWLLERREP